MHETQHNILHSKPAILTGISSSLEAQHIGSFCVLLLSHRHLLLVPTQEEVLTVVDVSDHCKTTQHHVLIL